jgi:hypothetical protein
MTQDAHVKLNEGLQDKSSIQQQQDISQANWALIYEGN